MGCGKIIYLPLQTEYYVTEIRVLIFFFILARSGRLVRKVCSWIHSRAEMLVCLQTLKSEVQLLGSVALCYCMLENSILTLCRKPHSLQSYAWPRVSNAPDKVAALWSKVETCILTSGPETLRLLYYMTPHLLNKANLLLTGSLSDYPSPGNLTQETPILTSHSHVVCLTSS